MRPTLHAPCSLAASSRPGHPPLAPAALMRGGAHAEKRTSSNVTPKSQPGLFNSQLEAAKFEGAAVRAAAGLRLSPLPHLLASAALAALAAFAPPAFADPAASAGVAEVVSISTSPSTSSSPTLVASFPASGLVFKDTVEVVSLPDPVIDGVIIYITEVRWSLVDKLTSGGGGFFAEPAAASVTCVSKTGTGRLYLLPGADVGGPEGRDIFTERKSLSLVAAKTLRVRRIVDRAQQTVLYVAYNTRLSGPGRGGGSGSGGSGDSVSTDGAGGGTGSARYRTSVCALPLAVEG